MKDKPLTIIGAGLTGSLLAILLGKKGYNIHLYERRPDMRTTEISAGRSINLAISTRGIDALKAAGVEEIVMKHAIPMTGRQIHARNGNQSFQAYGRNDSFFINSISRSLLNSELMTAAEATGNVTIDFDHSIEDYNPESHTLTISHKGHSIKKTIAGPLFGSDGSASALRDSFPRHINFEMAKDELTHGYKELTIPPGPNGKLQMKGDALHIWPRRDFMMIALPNPDGTFTVTLFLPYEGENSFEKIQNKDDLLDFFKNEFPDAIPLMPSLTEDFFENPLGRLATVRCFPWSIEDKVLLLGDAAHAIVPFYGQGMNAGFESCIELIHLMDKHSDWMDVFRGFENTRKKNTDAIASLALQNFVEMRDHVGDSHFLLKKEISHWLERQFPEQYLSQYTLVSFSNTPYSTALNLGPLQDKLLSALAEGVTKADQIDPAKAKQLLDGYVRESKSLLK